MFADDEAVRRFVEDRKERVDMTIGQRAMQHAMLWPEAEKGGRGKKALTIKGFSGGFLSQARAVLAYSRPLADALVLEPQKRQRCPLSQRRGQKRQVAPRNLSAGQRAMIVAKLYPETEARTASTRRSDARSPRGGESGAAARSSGEKIPRTTRSDGYRHRPRQGGPQGRRYAERAAGGRGKKGLAAKRFPMVNKKVQWLNIFRW